MRRFLLFGPIVALVLAVNLVGTAHVSRALAQESTPAATCVAPELSPASPEAQAEAGGEEPAGPATPAGEAPADEATAAAAIAGMENLIACINGGDFVGLSALMTESFIHNYLGAPSAADVPAAFEGVAPLDVVSLDNVLTYEDGSVSVDLVFTGFFNGQNGIAAERWFLVEDGGFFKINFITSIALPEGALPGAHVVDVTMVDFAFALSESTLPADTPIIFRFTNESTGGEGHVAALVAYPDGTTPESLITGASDIEASTAYFGSVYLEPGLTGDLVVTGLAAGTYFLACDVETASGTLHHGLGMVAQITVE